MTRQRRERAVSNSMSCTDEEWRRIRAAATAAGEGIGRHVVRRCLTDDPSPNARPLASQALSPEQQRRMYNAILGFSRVKPDLKFPEHPELWALRRSVLLLCRKRFVAMDRAGWSAELHAVLREAFGADGGPAVARSIRSSMEIDGGTG